MWNLKRKGKKIVLKNQGQDRNKDADVDNGPEDTGRARDKLGRSERVACIIYSTKRKIDS